MLQIPRYHEIQDWELKLNHAYLKNKGLKARYAITRSISLDCKASTMMKLFQKMVEPILLYNCEVAQACIPNAWDKEKFKIKMWEDREIDKVTKGLTVYKNLTTWTTWNV